MQTTSNAKRTIMPAQQHLCDKCPPEVPRPATYAVTDSREVPSSDPEGWREFIELAPRYGCDDHKPVATTFYLDGRILASADCVPEKTGEQKLVPSSN